jgi:hypothetical protein
VRGVDVGLVDTSRSSRRRLAVPVPQPFWLELQMAGTTALHQAAVARGGENIARAHAMSLAVIKTT